MKEKAIIPASIDFISVAMRKIANLTAAMRLAAALEESGDKKAAAEIYRDAVKIHPEDFELRQSFLAGCPWFWICLRKPCASMRLPFG